jgi:hypothetical protein
MIEIDQDHANVIIHMIEIDDVDDVHLPIVENQKGNYLIEIKYFIFDSFPNIRDRSSSNNRRQKRDGSRSTSNHESSSKRLHVSSKDDKHRTSHSHQNGNSKKH